MINIEYLNNKRKTCSINDRLLNLNKKNVDNKNIFVLNLFDENIYDNDEYDVKSNIFVGIIPSKTKCFISSIYHKITMNNLFNRISDFGIAIQGLFNIKPITFLTECMTNTNDKISYIIIDNHTKISIIDQHEIISYIPYGVNVQYIEGIKLYHNGKSYIDNIQTENICNNNIFYELLHMYLIIAIDKNNDTYIIYYPITEISKINELLNDIECENAILLCKTGVPNIIWKQENQNTINNNYIGNVNDIVSDILIFTA